MLGASPGEVILSDSTSVNLYKLAAAALAARARGRRFPTSAGRDLRRRILVALEFLAWLDQEELTLRRTASAAGSTSPAPNGAISCATS